jgi:DNA repair protein SbcD/Mre11
MCNALINVKYVYNKNRERIFEGGSDLIVEKIKFIHCADLHLDSPFVGLQYMPKHIFKRIQESTFIALNKMVDAAISKKVDFVIISGDLFDGEDRSIKAQARLRKQMERLQEEKIEVFIIHGNHDHLGGTWTTIDMPENVHIFSSDFERKEFISVNGVKVHLYGFSYPERHVKERKIDVYKKESGADYHIGILHGHCEGGSILHQPYAPFSIRDLLEKNMDYWALGHIHKQQILHNDPYIVYPGNIQGRNRKEEKEKGCFAVTLSKHETTLQFIETSDIIWETLTISAEGISYLNDLYMKCKDGIETIRQKGKAILFQLGFEHIDKLEEKALEKITNGEFLEILQDGEEQEGSFVWTYQIKLLNERDRAFPNADHPLFKKELDFSLKEFEKNDVFEQAISELFSHVQSSRYLLKLSSDEKTELLNEANIMVSQWLSLR